LSQHQESRLIVGGYQLVRVAAEKNTVDTILYDKTMRIWREYQLEDTEELPYAQRRHISPGWTTLNR
jgi:hypothetical protein